MTIAFSATIRWPHELGVCASFWGGLLLGLVSPRGVYYEARAKDHQCKAEESPLSPEIIQAG